MKLKYHFLKIYFNEKEKSQKRNQKKFVLNFLR